MGILYSDQGLISLASTVEREDGSLDPMFDPADPALDPAYILEMEQEEEDDGRIDTSVWLEDEEATVIVESQDSDDWDRDF